MKYEIISTGSKGNCIILNEDFMLDCGVAYSKIKDYLKDIKYIFIGHEHSDHLKSTTIKKIAFEYPNIKFIVGHYLADKLIGCKVAKKNIFVLELEKEYQIGQYIVHLDMLYHDVPNCCIHISKVDTNLSGEKYKLIYATDTSKIDHIEAKDYDYALIEANYLTDDELDEKIKEEEEKGKYVYYRRVKETHLSQLQAFNWLQSNNIKNYKFIHEHIEKEEKSNE